MSFHISFPAYQYEQAYLGTFKIESNKNQVIVKLLISSDKVVSFKFIDKNDVRNIEVPVSHLGTYAVMINYNALRNGLISWGRSSGALADNAFPIIFTFKKNYGTYGILAEDETDKKERKSVAVLSGISVSEGESKNKKVKNNHYYLLIIRSPSCYYVDSQQGSCLLFSFIIIDEYIKNRLIGAAKENTNRYEVEIRTSAGSVRADESDLYVFALKHVKTFLRAFPFIDFDSLTDCISNGNLQLCSGDLEYIYIGSQITVKCGISGDCMSWLRRRQRKEWKSEKSYYFVSPIISYPMVMPESSARHSQSVVLPNAVLPKDSILRTGVVKFSISDFTWDKAVKLIDCLWNNHKDAIFKLLLNGSALATIASLIGVSRFYYTEYWVTTTLYGKNIITYSPSINKILHIYNSINKSDDLIETIIQLLQEVGIILDNDQQEMLRKLKNKVKKVLAIFALAYGLHGISHLLMKALTALTGITDYTEFIKIEVETSGLPADIKKVGFKEGYYHENLFEIVAGDKFDLSVYVVSRVPYSYGIYKDKLIDNSNLKLDGIKAELRRIISRDGKDACEERWYIEKNALNPHRNILLNNQILFSNQVTQGNVLSAADAYIRDYLNPKNPNAKFRPPRSLFRFLYGRYIRRGILDKLRQQGIQVQQLGKVIDTYIQYLWPYHLPQCVDGCYGCVLTERSIRSMTCDLSPLVQELKISKWSALCLLKYAGLIDEAWVDCDLS
jgi:hypothetical protein